jgi:hypothetical protein
MVETVLPLNPKTYEIDLVNGKPIWDIGKCVEDLIVQGGLDKEDTIYLMELDFDKRTKGPILPFFYYKDRRVFPAHEYRKYLIVSMEGQEDDDFHKVMDAFSKVVEYKPHCKYDTIIRSEDLIISLPTYEWWKKNIIDRYAELSNNENVANLSRL